MEQTSVTNIRNFSRLLRLAENGKLSYGNKDENRQFFRELDHLLSHHKVSEASLKQQLTPAPPIRLTGQTDLILVGQIGLAGTYLTGRYFTGELSKTLPSWLIHETDDCLSKAMIYPSAGRLMGCSPEAIYCVGEGGLFRTLYQFSKEYQTGFHVHYSSVPISQHTIEFCEVFDIDPFSFLSCGCTLIAAKHGHQICRALDSLNIPCHVIGYTTTPDQKQIFYRDMISGINRPAPDGLLSAFLSCYNKV